MYIAFCGLATIKINNYNLIFFILYNLIAFGFQPLIGYIFDCHPKIPLGIIGILLTMTGLLFINYPYMAIIICALGNASFHIGGGADSLIHSANRFSRPGIFVSSGAAGVPLGIYLGKYHSSFICIPVILMIISFALLLFMYKKGNSLSNEQPDQIIRHDYTFSILTPQISQNLPIALLVVFSLLSIFIRSYAGYLIPTPYKTLFYSIIIGICACIGKASGGILADKFGARNISILSLVISAPLLVLGADIPLMSLCGIILFNMVMSINLCSLAFTIKKRPGFAFGISALILFIGFIVNIITVIPESCHTPALITLILVSAICTGFSVINKKQN